MISGESAKRIRDILRRANGAFRQDWLSDKFQYSPQRACELAAALETANFVERDRDREERHNSPVPWYSVTTAGWSVVRATAAQRITRTTAETALHEFMKRVHLVNANASYLYSVKKVAVFGSFLDQLETLGDVDIAVDLQPRISFDEQGKWIDTFRQHAWDSKRSFSTLEAEVDWPRQEVILVLKSRKRSISIQTWISFVEMCKAPAFRFRILLGDPKTIRREVASVRSKQE
jgi:predicted nucleotidyltransferase